MKEFLRTVLAVIVAAFILVFLVGIIGYAKSAGKPSISDGSYLVLSLEGEIVDYPPGGFAEELFGGGPGSHMDLLENLEKASVDKRIKGVILRVGGSTLGYAKMDELRSAIKKVQDSGKTVYAYSDGLYNRHFYVAAACDSIFMPPSGYVELTGPVSGHFFVKRALDKLGVKPNIHRIEKYKSAAELVTREDMSPEAEEQARWIMEDLHSEFVKEVASARSLDVGELEKAFEKAIFQPEEALEAGLIDGVLYWDELERRLRDPDDKKLETVSGKTYARVKREEVGIKGKKIAIVHAQGLIHSGESGTDPLMGMTMGARSVVRDLREVMDDDDIVGVVFRVDSPGGSGLASDIIGRWAKRVETKKPIVVSMADVAASGGYMVSHRTRPIVADPNTITGSIGSITGKFNMRGLYDKLGVTFDFVWMGPHALINSDYFDWTDEEAKMVAENHWKGFDDWLNDIAKHRDMTYEQVKAVAGGRVWTGRQAIERNLVDKLGGLDVAIAEVKKKAGISEEEEVTLVHYPAKKGIVETILSGDLAAQVKSVLTHNLRGYLLKWSLEGRAGWCVMPYTVE